MGRRAYSEEYIYNQISYAAKVMAVLPTTIFNFLRPINEERQIMNMR